MTARTPATAHAAGLAVAAWTVSVLKQLGPATLSRLKEITIDWRVLGFTLVVSLVTGIVFGLGFVISFGYWTTDFLVVQRILAAKDIRSAEMAPIIGAGFKMLVRRPW